MVANNSAVVTDNNMATVSTHHVMISGGGNTVLHASGFNSGILKQNIKFTNKHFFIRIPEVAELDKNISSNITNSSDSEHKNVFYENGTIDGMNYVAKLTNCRMTAYYSQNTTGGSGLPLSVAKSVGSFNLPYGTKIFIPYLKGRWGNTDGIVTVSDTGVGCTTFDLYLGKTLSDVTSKMKSPLNVDAYIIEYGTGKIAWSYTESFNWAYNYYNGNISRFKTAFNNYMQYGGTLINFWKFKDDDKNIRNTIYIQSGVYSVTAIDNTKGALYIPSNTTLIINGTISLKANNYQGCSVLYINNANKDPENYKATVTNSKDADKPLVDENGKPIEEKKDDDEEEKKE